MPVFTRDAVQLHYELDGSGSPAVYISGFSSHSNAIMGQNLRAALGKHHQILSVDNRGSGQTITPEGTEVTIEAMADDIAALIDQHDLAPAHVLGISMGGAIAMMLALRHPEKVRSQVVAVSLAYSDWPSRGEFLLRTSRAMRDRGIPRDIINRNTAVYLLAEDVFRHEDFMEVWVNSPADPFEQTVLGFNQQTAALAHYDIRDQLSRLTTPTLVISSPDDLLVPPHYQDEIAAAIPGAQIRHYPGGHIFMMLPMYAAGFVEDVLTFWGQHSA